jgi:hypothetical protein
MYKRMLIFSLLLLPSQVFGADQELCFFEDGNGRLVQVNGRSRIPARLRKTARCVSPGTPERLAKPEEISLDGTIRTENMASNVGRIQLRWPRSIEKLFGRTPQRAMADAARTMDRALKQAGFAPEVQNLDLQWNIVFMDQSSGSGEIPSALISNCHPGWMTPVANIYVVAQRVVAGCSGGGMRSDHSVADGDLTELLLHEMGHALEYQLAGNSFGGDRMRAEGFATWFASFAADFSPLVERGKLKEDVLERAKISIKESPDNFQFSGSSLDYARAAMYFAAIVDRQGVRGLMRVYAEMNETGKDFFSAINTVLYWDRDRLEKEVRRLL